MTKVVATPSRLLDKAGNAMGDYYNPNWKLIKLINTGEVVMLNGKNILSEGGCNQINGKIYCAIIVLSIVVTYLSRRLID
jgi:hypothetical protein